MKEHHKHAHLKHHHHKHELEHHKHREMHHKHHSAMKHAEYGHHAGHHPDGKSSHMMHDNRMVQDTHQEGISRVKMKKGELEVGQHGSMSGGWRHGKQG